MEVVGVVASVSQLASYLIFVSKSAADLYEAFTDAPEEYQRIKDQVGNLHLRLEEIKCLYNELGDNQRLVSSQFRSLFEATLSIVEKALVAVQKALRRTSVVTSSRARLRWVIVGHDTIEKHLARLENAEQGLNSVLQVLSLRLSNLNRQILEEIGLKIQTLQIGRTNASKTDGPPLLRVDICRRLGGNSTSSIGVLGSVASYISGKDTISSMSVCLMLSFFLLQKAILLRLKTSRSCWTQISLRRGSLRMVSIVPLDSGIVRACSRGDLEMVRQLLESGHATPHDVTPDGNSVLHLAVRNGHISVVQCLIGCDADVNLKSGQDQMTPLRRAFADRNLEMSRTLINSDADLDEVDHDGATILEALWSYNQKPYESQIDFINLLKSLEFSEFATADCDGWTALHWCSSYGTAEDLKAMIRYGADACAFVHHYGCQALHFAAQYSNPFTLEELLKNHEVVDVNAPDLLGLTPLHIAVGNGDSGIIDLLIKYGARTDLLNGAKQ